MKAHVHEHRDDRLALGLLVGSVVGAGLAWWFAPRLAELRQRLEESGTTVRVRMGDVADVGDAADELVRKRQILRSDLAEADADADAIARAADDGAGEPVRSTMR
jgi:hypothetical protein